MAFKSIRKAAVIGGGVMGRGIAAHLANAHPLRLA
jgi:3-hydroxyacyl-CoA dehydrogenase